MVFKGGQGQVKGAHASTWVVYSDPIGSRYRWSWVVNGGKGLVTGGRGWSMVVNLRSKVDWTWVVYSDQKGSRLFKC